MEIGIDIGTSYSSVAVLEKGKAVPIKPGKEIVYSIPSAVYAQEGKLIIGRLAEVNRKQNPSCYKSNFKKDFGSQEPYILGDMRVRPEQIYTEYYKYFKESAEQYAGEKVSKAYITHPANYGEDKQKLIRQAAQYAGLFDVELLEEPLAAGLSFFSDRELLEGERLLVYDFGGGTFDTALLKMEKDGLRLIGEPMGMDWGGTSFDRILYQDLVKRLPGDEAIEQALKRPKFQWLVIEQTVEAKHILSSEEKAVINIPMGYGEFIECAVTRQEFDKMIEKKVKESLDIVKKMLERTGVGIEQVDKVLCVGGTTRIPYITEQLEKLAGKPLLKTVDPELAVCCGAALKGQILVRTVLPTEEKQEIKKIEEKKVEEGKTEKTAKKTVEKEKTEKPVKTVEEWIREGLEFEEKSDNEGDKFAKKAFQCYENAANMGSAEGQYQLGECYRSGFGIAEDKIKAIYWYEKAANQNLKVAQNALGRMYKGGCAVEADYEKAFYWYQKAAEQGDRAAMYELGHMYEYGFGVKDKIKAFKWYRKAAEGEHGDYRAKRKLKEDTALNKVLGFLK